MTLPEHVDVLVVGAGPAGSIAASVTARAGLSTLLVDAKPRIGEQPHCGEFVPRQLFAEHDLPRDCIAQTVDLMETVVLSRLRGPADRLDNILLRSDIPSPGYLIDRPRFDRELARRCASEGSTVMAGVRLTDRAGDVWHVHDRNGTHAIRARYVIGADGAMSRTARLTGLQNPSVLRGIQAEVPLTVPLRKTIVMLSPDIEGGYGWLFPKGSVANAGLGVAPHSKLSPPELLDGLLEHLIRRNIVRPGRIAGTGGLIPVAGMRETLVIDNVLLCGDAAGLTHPITGAGIPQAVVSGARAGEAVVRAVRASGAAMHNELAHYEQDIRDHYAGVLRHALTKRQRMMRDLHEKDFADLCRRTWIGFREYRQREKNDS